MPSGPFWVDKKFQLPFSRKHDFVSLRVPRLRNEEVTIVHHLGQREHRRGWRDGRATSLALCKASGFEYIVPDGIVPLDQHIVDLLAGDRTISVMNTFYWEQVILFNPNHSVREKWRPSHDTSYERSRSV